MARRYAVIRRNRYCKEARTLERYLPDNYEIVRTLEDAFIVGGEDAMGWTMEKYVLPRLRSGNIAARELTDEEALEWVPRDEYAEVMWASTVPLHAPARVGRVHLVTGASYPWTLCNRMTGRPSQRFVVGKHDRLCQWCQAAARRRVEAGDELKGVDARRWTEGDPPVTGGAHVKRCDRCGREGTTGYTKIGNSFALRGRTRLAQRLNMESGPAIWECRDGFGCHA